MTAQPNTLQPAGPASASAVEAARVAAGDLLVSTADMFPPECSREELTDTVLAYRAALANLYAVTTPAGP